MVRIIGKASSINVRKVLWACEEIGIAYAHEDSAPEMALNPNGLVPVTVDGDFVLWESNTILRYLANKWRATWLLPTEPRARAEVERWIDWQATEFNTAWRYAFSALARRNPAFDDARQIEASKADWARMVGILDDVLSRQSHVAGDGFTLADIPIGLSVNRWFMTPMDKPAFPAVSAYYYDRLSRRPAFLKHGRNGIP